MPIVWRMALIIYNLLILLIAAGTVCMAVGISEPLSYINAVFATQENRMAAGGVAVIILIVTMIIMGMLFKRKRPAASVIVDSDLSGQVSITVPAIKVIIMKAVKRVDGIKDIRPVVTSGPDGLLIYLHMMINPERNVPEMSQSIQSIVKEYIEKIAGLQVAEIKILVDDFNAGAGKNTGK
ncbi:MAG: alkaline shock response membrane anchor protein AmaP [Syntrophomonas sp.]